MLHSQAAGLDLEAAQRAGCAGKPSVASLSSTLGAMLVLTARCSTTQDTKKDEKNTEI
jgi:hypothetical protein